MASNPQIVATETTSERHRDCRCGECLQIATPARDWIVSSIKDRGPGQYYRYAVTGTNLNYPPCSPDRRFSWSIPSVCERFDLTNALRIA